MDQSVAFRSLELIYLRVFILQDTSGKLWENIKLIGCVLCNTSLIYIQPVHGWLVMALWIFIFLQHWTTWHLPKYMTLFRMLLGSKRFILVLGLLFWKSKKLCPDRENSKLLMKHLLSLSMGYNEIVRFVYKSRISSFCTVFTCNIPRQEIRT